ncbi:MAG: class I SAM-dependent methyltransferase [Desulfomonilaceae bacterium]
MERTVAYFKEILGGEIEYQLGYSEHFAEFQFDRARQGHKAEKILSVLEDFYGGLNSLSTLTLLDLGCSAGLMTRAYSERFFRTVGIDIDVPAVKYAAENFSSEKLEFVVADAMNTGFSSGSFDVVTCTHVYEHVPDSNRLMEEIHRILKKGGICHFTAQNRMSVIEPHYGLPLLSVLPKSMAHWYLRILGKGKLYYENHLTLGELRRLVAEFECHDYTAEIIRDPVQYHATELLTPGSLKQKLALGLTQMLYFLCPTYVWILKK